MSFCLPAVKKEEFEDPLKCCLQLLWRPFGDQYVQPMAYVVQI
jgi:hypothetical protein